MQREGKRSKGDACYSPDDSVAAGGRGRAHVQFKMLLRSPRGDAGTAFIGQEEEKNPVKGLRELYGHQLF